MKLKVLGLLAIFVIALFAFVIIRTQEAQVGQSRDEPTVIKRGE